MLTPIPKIDRTFIRENGENVSIREASDAKFKAWLTDYFARAGAVFTTANTTFSALEREDYLEALEAAGIPPAMLTEDYYRETRQDNIHPFLR